jgi:hypothetical protein
MSENQTECFGRNLEAEKQYAAAWQAWREVYIDEERIPFERQMDRLQPLIAKGPRDPRWASFIDTLPGYRECWSFMKDQAMKKVHDTFREGDMDGWLG